MRKLKVLTEEELQPILVLALESESDVGFVPGYLSGVARSLINSPGTYRSFGPYWWPLKELLLKYSIDVFGSNVEAGTLNHFRLNSEDLVCVAAYAYQQQKLSEEKLLSTEHILDIEDGETESYILHDQKMEELLILKTMRGAKKTTS